MCSAYAFDPASGRHTETYTGQTDTRYAYDALGRLKTVTVAKLNGAALATPLVTTYGYDAAGGPDTSVLDPDGVETDTHVDLAHDERVVTIKKGSATLASFDYHLDADGRDLNVVEHQANVGGVTFADARIDWTYDADGRLASEKYDAGNNGPGAGDYTAGYQYDLANNRKVKTLDTGGGGTIDETTTSTYDADDKLQTETSTVSGQTTDTYDGNGSLKTSAHGGVTDTYSYDVRNRLVAATVGGQGVAYGYDDAGDRTAETAGGVTTTLVNDGQNPSGYGQVLEEHQGAATSPGIACSMRTASHASIATHATFSAANRLADAANGSLANAIVSGAAIGA